MFSLGKFSLIIVTRCNLRCKLCCEYVPQNKPFPDMTLEQEASILKEIFSICDHITTLHLTGGGEPFLHPQLPELIEQAMQYESQFDTLMLFTNSMVPLSDKMKETLKKYKDKILVQVSRYGIKPEREEQMLANLAECGVRCKAEKYYGEDQSFGGWVDFGHWDSYHRNTDELSKVFHECSVTKIMKGNWRTRDGKVHWCTRSQRGMELGLLPDSPDDYVNLLDSSLSVQEKREKFALIANKPFLTACNHCSGDQGTTDQSKRYRAAEQLD